MKCIVELDHVRWQQLLGLATTAANALINDVGRQIGQQVRDEQERIRKQRAEGQTPKEVNS